MKLKSLSQKDRYGNMFSVEFFEPSIPSMMIIPEMSDGYNGADTSDHPGDPRGTDTVPAWLTPGENVVNAEASRIPGNQEKIDDMNEEGRMIQKAQGGPIPTYESDGGRITPPMYAEMGSYVPSEIPSWLTPDLLDSLMQVESGGDVNAVSKAGAVGPYQIMPATAANPGYNTQAITEADMRDPDVSRRFAQQYLSGIQASNPDFTPAEVLQAYNAGAGRIANFKAGKGKPLAEETVQYADKVLSGVPSINEGDVPVYDFGDQTDQEPGFMSAQAATAPSTSEELSVPRLNDGRIPGRDEDSRLAKQGERMRNAPVENAEERVKITEDYIRKYIDEGLVPPESVVNANKSAKIELEKVTKEEELLQQENIAKADAEAKAEKKRLDDSRAALGLPPTDVPIPELDGVGIPEVSTKEESKETQAKKDAAMAEAMKSFRGKTFNQPSADEMKEVERLGSSPQGEGLGAEVMGYFKQMFKDLFSGPELARMAVTYAGSRLMGYDHGGSLQYSMQQYINRVDSDVEARKKFVTSKDALANYTGKSLQAYRDSGNLEDLVAKGKTLSMEKPTGNSYLPGIGKVQRFLGTDGNEYVEFQGAMTPVSTLAGFLEPWDEDTQGRKAVAAQFKAALDSATATANTERGLRSGTRNKTSYDDRVAIDSVKLAGEAESRYREILRQNGVSINDVPELQISVNNAITKYVNDTIDFKQSGGKGTKPNSIRAYINAETRSVLTGVPQFAMNGASENNMNVLDDMIKKEVKDDEGKRIGPKDKGYADKYENLWLATYEAYQLRSEYPDLDSQSGVNLEELVEKKAKSEDPANKWTPFTLWMSRTPWTEVQAIIEQAKLDGKL